MPITVNTTDTFEQWRLKTNDVASGLETNVTSVYSALSSNVSTLNSSIASGTANVFAGLTSNVNTLNSSIASNTAASFAGLTSNVNTINSSIAANTAAIFAGLTSNITVINSSISSNASTINSSIVANVNTLNSAINNRLQLSGGTMTGAITTPNGAVGINIGDDARLSDRNAANTLFLEGIQNNDRGYVNFSTTAGNELGSLNGGALTWRGATVLHSSNYNSFAPTLTGTGASGTWGINISGTATYATNPGSGGNFITSSNFRSASGYDYLQYVSMPSYVVYYVRGDVSYSLGGLPATGSWVNVNLSGVFVLRPNLDIGGGLEASGLVQYLLLYTNYSTVASPGYYVARKNNGVWIDDELIGGLSYFTLNKGEWITEIATLVVPVGDGVGGGDGGVF